MRIRCFIEQPLLFFIISLFFFNSCSGSNPPETPAPMTAEDSLNLNAQTCPSMSPSSTPLPNVSEEHLTQAYWLQQWEEDYDLDATLMDISEIARHNRSLSNRNDGNMLGLFDLLALIDTQWTQTELDDRLNWLRDKLHTGSYLSATGELFSAAEIEELTTRSVADSLDGSLYIALDHVSVRCGPLLEGYYTPALDLRFDRNNCSTIRPQEVLQIIMPWPDDRLLVRSSYTFGWIPADTPLSTRLTPDEAQAFIENADLRLNGSGRLDLQQDLASLPRGTWLPAGSTPDTLLYATSTGIAESEPLSVDLIERHLPLTRRALLNEAFAYFNTAYGWGGQDSGFDCSRLLMEIFETFALKMPRHSANQALSGSFSIDVSHVESETEKQLLIDSAMDKGLVLLHFPGHIMLYLGRDQQGVPMAMHAFAEYLVPCDEGTTTLEGETESLFTVDNVTISDLELGRGTSRRAFIERITKIIVLGPSPGIELSGISTYRPPAPVQPPPRDQCDDSAEAAIFIMPKRPVENETLRIVSTTEVDFRPAELLLIPPEGAPFRPASTSLGGPPYSLLSTVENPVAGQWQAVLGEGDKIIACWPFRVRRHSRPTPTASAPLPQGAHEPGAPTSEAGTAAPAETFPVWETRRPWTRATENLYAAWVESLFNYPIDADLTWHSLQGLLQDESRNFLFNYLGHEEDSQVGHRDRPVLYLEPDCADLPYLLRAYFSWKMGLPFAYQRCSRGGPGRPPSCHSPTTNMSPREIADDVGAFVQFANRRVRSGVHSASARTHPEDNQTDFYPVALSRDSLRPGTVFADPFGHLLIIVKWIPQDIDNYGILIGADAQPDGTVGRRRFWRGSFLFHPETDDVGAGFKFYRPLIRASSGAPPEYRWLDNERLLTSERYTPFSLEQYQGSTNDFYDQMGRLINPRPLDPFAMQLSLIDALEESVSRRVTSVQNAENFMEERGYADIDMPEGASIFQTSGPWEDYSTPSRDMRLLIAIDTVMRFPDLVRDNPADYGLVPTVENPLDTIFSHLRADLRRELDTRTFDYIRSNGTAYRLTLLQLTDRKVQLEMAYNPNDCVELRWGASPSTTEWETCQRRAPEFQTERMTSYRPWFETRQRPVR